MPFIDQEKGELRSIDIVAQIFPKDDDPALPPTKFMKLYIECKKRHKGTMVFYFGSREESLIKKSFIENQYENRSNLYYLSYAGIKLNEIGLSYEIVKCDDFLLTAQMQLLKCITFHETVIEYQREMIIPSLIFEGSIFQYIHDEKEPILRKVDYIPYLSHGLPFDPTPTYIDIVTLDSFETYLTALLKKYYNLPREKYPESLF